MNALESRVPSSYKTSWFYASKAITLAKFIVSLNMAL